MSAFFIFTFNSYFIIKKLYVTVASILLALYFTDSWSTWELYLVSFLGITCGWISSNVSPIPWKKANSVETLYYAIILPFYTLALFPLVIPQTGVAAGCVLAMMLWFFIAIIFHNFYEKHKRTLDPLVVGFVLAVYLFTFILYPWRWGCFGAIVGFEVVWLFYHGHKYVE